MASNGLVSSIVSFIAAFGGVAVPSIVLLDDDHASSSLSSVGTSDVFPFVDLALRRLAIAAFSYQCHIVKTSRITNSTRLYVRISLLENKTASTIFRNRGSFPGFIGSVVFGDLAAENADGVNAVAERDSFMTSHAHESGISSIRKRVYGREGIKEKKEERSERVRHTSPMSCPRGSRESDALVRYPAREDHSHVLEISATIGALGMH